MEKNSNFGMYLRLQRELMDAYVEPICDHDRIQRLTDDLAAAHGQVQFAADVVAAGVEQVQRLDLAHRVWPADERSRQLGG